MCDGLMVRVVGAVVFFFSRRRRDTRFKCDWSSDVCSSDLKFGLASTPNFQVCFPVIKVRESAAVKLLECTRNNPPSPENSNSPVPNPPVRIPPELAGVPVLQFCIPKLLQIVAGIPQELSNTQL